MAFSTLTSYQLQISERHSLGASLDPEGEESEDDSNFSYGIHAVPSANPKKEIVSLHHSGTNKTYSLFTNAFVWNYTWLNVTIVTSAVDWGLETILRKNNFSVLKYGLSQNKDISPFALFLESVEKDLREHSLIERKGKNDKDKKNLTPNEIQDQDAAVFRIAKGSFLDYLRGNVQTLELRNFFNILDEFAASNFLDSQVSALNIKKMVGATTSGSVLMCSIHAPRFFELGPMLFPKKIVSLMQKTSESAVAKSEKAQLQGLLDNIIENEPWQIGFSEVIYRLSKTLSRRWSGLESGLKQMKTAPFFKDGINIVQKDALHLYDLIKDVCRRNGHTYLNYHNIQRDFNYFNSKKYHHIMTSIPDAINFLEEQAVLFKDEINRYHLMSFKRAEDKIVSCLRRMLKEARNLNLNIDFESESFARIRKDKDQLKAAQMISQNSLTIISGRGGTGKTEVVVTVLKAIDEKLAELNTEKDEEKDQNASSISDGLDSSLTTEDPNLNGRILFTAPTGKAASVMRKRSGKKAFTMHQVLSSFKNYKNNKEKSRWKFADTKVLAVDESSMVSLELFSYLLHCLSIGAKLMKVVLLGDVLQLPSIDPGNFMHDMFKSLKLASCAVELTTNHRSEGSIISDNAERISHGMEPVFDRKKGFHFVTTDVISSLPSNVSRGADNVSPVTRTGHFIPLRKNVDRTKFTLEKEHMYLGLLRNQLEVYDLVDPKKSQFIAFRRAECQVINEFCCKVYNDHYMYLEGTDKRNIPEFCNGDKIMSTRNSDVPLLAPFDDIKDYEFVDAVDPSDVPSVGTFDLDSSQYRLINDRLMNGNVYTIEKVKKFRQQDPKNDNQSTPLPPPIEIFELDDLAGEIILPLRVEFERFCKPAHAWALTIHKFQGSEADTIVYGVSDSPMENWQHVYTAVTRGKKRVIIVGRWQDLVGAIKRNPRPRQTTLSEKITELLDSTAMPSDDELELAMSTISSDPTGAVSNLTESCLLANDESFDIVLSQMNDQDFSEFTQVKVRRDETFDEDFDTFIATQGDLNGCLLGDSPSPNRRRHLHEMDETATSSEDQFLTPKMSKSSSGELPKTPNISSHLISKLKM